MVEVPHAYLLLMFTAHTSLTVCFSIVPSFLQVGRLPTLARGPLPMSCRSVT